MASRKKQPKKKGTKVRGALPLNFRPRDPLTGKFIKPTVAAIKKAERDAKAAYRKASSERNKAARSRFKGAKTAAKRRELDRRYRRAARAAARIAEKLRIAEAQRREAESQRPGRRKASVIEIGLNYESAKATSDVNINVRIRKKRGAVTDDDAYAVIEALGVGDEIPPEYEVTAVEWQRPSRSGMRGDAWRGGSKPSDLAALDNFASIFWTAFREYGHDGFRIGGVKEPEL